MTTTTIKKKPPIKIRLCKTSNRTKNIILTQSKKSQRHKHNGSNSASNWRLSSSLPLLSTTTPTATTDTATSSPIINTNTNTNNNTIDNNDDIPCDALLAFQSLLQSNTTAYCPLLPIDHTRTNRFTCHAPSVPLVLRSMIHHSLWSRRIPDRNKEEEEEEQELNGGRNDGVVERLRLQQRSVSYSTTTTTTKPPPPTTPTPSNRTKTQLHQGNQTASANASTGVRIELTTLCRTNQLRLLQLHNCGASNTDDDVAVLEYKEYVRAVWDAHRFYRMGVLETTMMERNQVTDGGDGGDGNGGGGGGISNHTGTNKVIDSSTTTDDSWKSGTLEEKGVVIAAFITSQGWDWSELYVTERDLLPVLATALFCHRRPSRTRTTNGPDIRGTGSNTTSVQTNENDDNDNHNVNHDKEHNEHRPNQTTSRRIATWAIHYLVSINILLPRHTTLHSPVSSYYFTLPKLAAVGRSLSIGRERMVMLLKRSRYKEIRRSVLEQRERKYKVGEVVIGGVFLVKDLLSRGVVTVKIVPSGQFIRLV